jgi:2'-5' RNA ligase
MAPRSRLGVMLVIPGATAIEIDGLRRAVGSSALQRIPPHVTVVPPFNIDDARITEIVDQMRSAAADEAPIRVRLGPAATFWPRNPVVYLQVADDGGVARLHHRFVTNERRPFVPHVTVGERVEAERIGPCVAALSRYAAEVTITEVQLMRFDPVHRHWDVIADAPLGGARVIGRGGLEVTVDTGSVVGPAAAHLVDTTFVITARREGAVVGAATGTVGVDLRLTQLVVDPAVRGQGIGRHVLAAVERFGVEHGCGRAIAHGRSEWLVGHGWVVDGGEMVRSL